jgi:hydrogenase 3 maturation protease
MSAYWLHKLKKKIKGVQKICMLSVGNTKRGDDAFGPLALVMILSRLKRYKFKSLLFINGGETPENFTADIRRFQPALTIILDSCVSGKKPGTIYIVDPEKIQFDDISTHRLPLSMLAKFLEKTIPTKVIILGIEPANLNFGDDISPEVNKAIDNFVLTMVQILNEWKETGK